MPCATSSIRSSNNASSNEQPFIRRGIVAASGGSCARTDGMSNRTFRFGVVATPQAGRGVWLDLAKHVEEMGYSTLLMPDGLQLLSPFVTLSMAAAVTTSLRVGTFVVASPLRHPTLAAWEAHTTSVMTGERFELGIGTGRPEAARQAVEELGMPAASPARRLAQVEQTIDALRELDGERHTPVMIAAGGPKARASGAPPGPTSWRCRFRRWPAAMRWRGSSPSSAPPPASATTRSSCRRTSSSSATGASLDRALRRCRRGDPRRARFADDAARQHADPDGRRAPPPP